MRIHIVAAFVILSMTDLDRIAVIKDAIATFDASVHATNQLFAIYEKLAERDESIKALTLKLEALTAVCDEMTAQLESATTEKTQLQAAFEEMASENEKLAAEMKEQGEKLKEVQYESVRLRALLSGLTGPLVFASSTAN